MLYVESDGTIKLTRGDSAYLEVPIYNLLDDGSKELYELANSDTMRLSVKKSVDDDEYVFQKVVEGSNLFHILPDDTNHCEVGKYKYDVELTTAAGDVYTVIEPTYFRVLPEVTSR